MRRLAIGIIGALGLVGLLHLAGTFTPSPKEPQKKSRVDRNSWEGRISLEGELVTQELLMQYQHCRDIMATGVTQELDDREEKDYLKFAKDTTYGNFTMPAFMVVYTYANRNMVLDLERVASMFDQHDVGKMIEYIKGEKNNNKVVSEVVRMASYMTRKKLKLIEVPEQGSKDYFANLARGFGDCSEYGITIANLSYFAFITGGREDLLPRVRLTYGALTHSEVSHQVVAVKTDEWGLIDTTRAKRVNRLEDFQYNGNYSEFVPIFSTALMGIRDGKFDVRPVLHVRPNR